MIYMYINIYIYTYIDYLASRDAEGFNSGESVTDAVNAVERCEYVYNYIYGYVHMIYMYINIYIYIYRLSRLP